MKFADIPQLTAAAPYTVNQSWDLMGNRASRGSDKAPIEGWLNRYIAQGLILDPDFQRGRVWSVAQQRSYVEYRLRGGNMSGRHIFLNDPFWMKAPKPGAYADFVLVDGLQRITAVQAFLANELAVFDGTYFKDFEDTLRVTECDFIVCVNTLPSRAAVLKWYLEINSTGEAHTTAEIERVRALLKDAA